QWRPKAEKSRIEMMADMQKTMFMASPDEETPAAPERSNGASEKPAGEMPTIAMPKLGALEPPLRKISDQEWEEAEIRARLMAESREAEDKARQDRWKSRGETSRLGMMSEMQ